MRQIASIPSSDIDDFYFPNAVLREASRWPADRPEINLPCFRQASRTSAPRLPLARVTKLLLVAGRHRHAVHAPVVKRP